MLLFTPSSVLSAGFYGPRGGDSTFYNFSTSTAITPASGTVRLNSATPSLVTAIYVHETNRDNVNVAVYLDQITAGSQIILIDDANRSNYATYTVALVTDNGTNRTISVTYVNSGGTLADNAKAWFSILTPTATSSTVSIFGNGADGPLLCDGVAAVTGMTLVSANIYRLDRDIYATTLTVNSGVTIKPGNSTAGTTPTWRIFCSVALLNNGTIQTNGTDAGSGVLQAAGSAGAAAGNAGGSIGGAGNGTTGRIAGTGAGPSGLTGIATDPTGGGAGGNGGTGGNGINGGGGAGNAGAVSIRPFRYVEATVITLSSAGAITTLRGGSGGGGGGAGGGNGTGLGGGSGGSGGGGGLVFIWAKAIINTGTISANGGNGGNGGIGGTAGGGATGGGAGGGGGGGGWIYLVYGSISNTGTISVNGGAKGTGAAGGNGGGTGGDGVAGSAGEIVRFNASTNSFE